VEVEGSVLKRLVALYALYKCVEEREKGEKHAHVRSPCRVGLGGVGRGMVRRGEAIGMGA
jgi:hypothetical protein